MNNSFSLFLNIILGSLFIGSLIFSSFFGNFGGISLEKLNKEYLLKKELSFSNLSSNEQKKYISRDKFKKTIIVPEKIFDNDGNPIVKDASDLEQITISLQNKISFLEKENILLSTDKDELLKIVKYEKSKNNSEQKTLLSSNLEKINEAEKQHFLNITELTKKINDLQRENIKLSQQINQKDEHSKDLEINLKRQNEDQKRLLLKKEQELKTIYEAKILDAKKLNQSKQRRLVELENRLTTKDSLTIIELGKKDQKIELLKNKINKLMIEKNRFLTKKSKDILNIENENSQKLKELNNIVINSNSEKESIREEYKKVLEKAKKKYKEIEKEQQKEIDRLNQELSNEKQNSAIAFDNNKQNILKNKEEFKIEIESVSKQKTIEIDRLKKEIYDLKAQVNAIGEDKQKIISELDSKTLELNKSKDSLLQIQDKIKALDKSERDVDSEVSRLVFKNEKKHNINYKILNQKIAELEMDVKSKQKDNSKILASFSSEKAELTKKLNSILSENRQKNSKIIKLEASLEKIGKKNKNLALNDNEKLAMIKKSFDDLKNTIKIREKDYNQKVKELQSDIFLKDNELRLKDKDKEKLGKYIRDITALKKTLKEIENDNKNAIANHNLKLLSKIECNDMISGNFKISSTCKAKVDKFLSKYKKTDFFEVIPIVGSGGFASLNKVKRDGRLGIAESEIKRLTRLANIGLGRDRAKEGGWLIRDKFGDDVKISYTVYSIESKNKRGFVIRAYR